MTQQEKPVTPEKAEQPVPVDSLSIESIGWLFIQKYYSAYTGDIGKLFALYDADASLLHDEFPDPSEHATAASGEKTTPKTVHQAVGTAAIKSHFSAQVEAAQTNKIVVERADFQKSVGDSILIVVSGSWKRGNASLLQFVQTFVLRPKEKTVYDIANDVLKFLDFSELYREVVVADVAVSENGSAEEVNAVSNTAEATEVAQEESAVSINEEEVASEAVVAQSAAEPAEVAETVGAPKNSEVPEPVTAETSKTEESVATESTTDTESEAPVAKSAESDEELAPPPVKPTWANLAAIEPKNSKVTLVLALALAPALTVPAVKPVAKKSVSPQVAPSNGKYRREEWYPIYIRNIDVDEEELKKALVRQFGDIKFFKRNSKAALCDFRNKEDQQKALEAKEIVIGTNVILLETRVHKPFNGKPDFKKEKKAVKKSGVKKN